MSVLRVVTSLINSPMSLLPLLPCCSSVKISVVDDIIDMARRYFGSFSFSFSKLPSLKRFEGCVLVWVSAGLKKPHGGLSLDVQNAGNAMRDRGSPPSFPFFIHVLKGLKGSNIFSPKSVS